MKTKNREPEKYCAPTCEMFSVETQGMICESVIPGASTETYVLLGGDISGDFD